jgi:hypothetical protein
VALYGSCPRPVRPRADGGIQLRQRQIAFVIGARKPFGRDATNTLTACDVDLVAERNRLIAGEIASCRDAGGVDVHGRSPRRVPGASLPNPNPSVRQAQPSNSLTRKENHTELDAQPPTAPRGARPLPPHGAAWGAKRAGEAGRRLPGGRKSAESANAGREGTSDPQHGPASESTMEKLGSCSNSDGAFAREPIIMSRTLSSDPCGGVWQCECYDIWLSGFACVSGRKSEACESFSKPEFVVVDHWPIGIDERLGRPLWADSRPAAFERQAKRKSASLA